MNTPISFRDLDYISQFALYVSLFFLSVSAYKRTKQKGFVCWGFAAIGYVLHTPMPFQQTRGYPRSHGPSATLLDIMHCLGVVNNVLMLVGIVLIIKGYVGLCSTHDEVGEILQGLKEEPRNLGPKKLFDISCVEQLSEDGSKSPRVDVAVPVSLI